MCWHMGGGTFNVEFNNDVIPIAQRGIFYYMLPDYA